MQNTDATFNTLFLLLYMSSSINFIDCILPLFFRGILKSIINFLKYT